MKYEKEIAELRKAWKKSIDKYEEAIEDGYDVDADMWSHDVMEIERQIYVYEQAARADEYEAKAEAFEKVAGIAYWYFERVNPEYADFSDYEGFYDDIKDEFKKYESGESDAKK